MLRCRRLLFTADPQYPAVTFFAKLPSLVLHINEHKVRGWNWLCPRKGVSTEFPDENTVHFMGVVGIFTLLSPQGSSV